MNKLFAPESDPSTTYSVVSRFEELSGQKIADLGAAYVFSLAEEDGDNKKPGDRAIAERVIAEVISGCTFMVAVVLISFDRQRMF